MPAAAPQPSSARLRDEDGAPDGEAELSEAQRTAVDHDEGPLLMIGAAGTGKTEVLARRLARLAEQGTGPEQVLVIASGRAAAARLRERAEALLEGSYEELWIGTWEAIGERLLSDYSAEAGLDPFFDVLGPAERLAMLLDRLEELPLRHHEIRGNPAGLLARLLRRIDALKAEAVGPEALGALAGERLQARRRRGGPARAARREHEFAQLYAAHDRILAAAGSLDSGDVSLVLRRLLATRADVAPRDRLALPPRHGRRAGGRDPARWAILAELSAESTNLLAALDDDQATRGPGARTASWFREVHPDAEVVVLERCLRGGSEVIDAARAVVAAIGERLEKPGRAEDTGAGVRFWRSRNERAQAQAVAREVEHLIAGGLAPQSVCVIVDRAVAPGERGRGGDGGAQHPLSPGRRRRRSSAGPRSGTPSPG